MATVGVAQGQGGLPQDVADLVHRQSSAGQHLLERLTGHVFHDDVHQARFVLDPVDRDDAGMVQLGRGLGLPLESGDQLPVASHVRWQDLDRHPTFEHQIFRQEHRGHAAPAQKAKNLVATLQASGEPFLQLVGIVRRAAGAVQIVHRDWRMTPGTAAHQCSGIGRVW
jgi:hypothetical protein